MRFIERMKVDIVRRHVSHLTASSDSHSQSMDKVQPEHDEQPAVLHRQT